MIEPTVWAGREGRKSQVAQAANRRTYYANEVAIEVGPRLLEYLERQYPLRLRKLGESDQEYERYAGKRELVEELKALNAKVADFGDATHDPEI